MSFCSIFRPTTRLVRVTRGLLILLTALAIVGTIAVIQRMEAAPKFTFGVHSAQRALQQLDVCRNCSQNSLDEDPPPLTKAPAVGAVISPSDTIATKVVTITPIAEAVAAIAAGEILSPEEALPEEMMPDQESPAVQPPAIIKQELPVAENSPQQQEHAQQQENLVDLVTIQQPAAVNSVASGVPIRPVVSGSSESSQPSRPRTVFKVQSADIEYVKNSVRPYPAAAAAAAPAPLQQVTKSSDEENPPVVTKLLYQPGHVLPPKDVCPERGEGMKLMILITTAPSHVAQRDAVRSTWGHVAFRRDVGMAFVVGTSKDQRANELVALENLVYGDIIQGRFIDTYNNLTLKTISMLEWSWKYCDRARFLLKTDDDMYIHMPVLLSILDGAANRRKTIMGKVAKRWKPIRNVTSKYYISPAQYKPAMYPDFNTGPAYILTNDIVEPLYRASLDGNFFKLEDVYVTGMMAAPLKIQHVDYPQFFNRRLKLDTCAVKKLASIHMVKTYEMFDLWKRLSDGLTRCTPKA